MQLKGEVSNLVTYEDCNEKFSGVFCTFLNSYVFPHSYVFYCNASILN
ncbi:hypothetical protein BARBAKC583_1107 [Bartonella bacilliformis KC583]|uniref:Uncharacterized protein n=1 Tax=Bartonella bacilliformis (strain ATCC 35685 / KC583 / Herrer 020/F12,63) TaxID=360095 RepID=A1UTR7_BARBK|nr:hypothetical protein BARBAKC583_1107 [Bartonella bacilliformis KC583]